MTVVVLISYNAVHVVQCLLHVKYVIMGGLGSSLQRFFVVSDLSLYMQVHATLKLPSSTCTNTAL